MIFNSKQKKVFLLLSILFPIISFYATPYMMVATASYFLFISGLLFINVNKNTHALLMSLAITMDLILVLTLELQRGAINTLLSFKLTPLNKVHIYASTMAVVLYFPLVHIGRKKLAETSTASMDKKHKLFGRITIVLRTIGFIFMFSLLK